MRLNNKKEKSVFSDTKFASRSIERSWRKLERKIILSVVKLNQEDLEKFLQEGLYYCPKREHYYINPDIDIRIKNMLKPIINRTGTIDHLVVDILHKIYKENLEITLEENIGFKLSRKRRRPFRRS